MTPEVYGGVDAVALRNFAEGLRQLVWIADDTGCREYFNGAWTRYTGLTIDQSRRNGWHLALHPEDYDDVTARWEAAAPAASAYPVSYRLRSVDGEYRLFTGAMIPLRDDTGTVRKWIGMVDDSETLARATDRFQILADALPLLVWTTDAEDRLTFVNRAWFEYTGLAAGSRIEERNRLVHPDDLPRLLSALRSGSPSVEFRFKRRRDLMYRWHLLRWEHVNLGEDMPFHRIGTAIDIHDMHVAQIERERQMHAIAEAVPDIVWSIRADGVQDYANSAMANFTGVPIEQTFGERWLDVIHPDDRDATALKWQHAFAGGHSYECKYRIRRHDGLYRWFLARATPLRDASGQIVRWFGTCTDVDDQVRATALVAESERHYRTLAEAIPDIVWSVDADNVVDYVNRAWYAFTGLPEDAAFDERAFSIYADADRDRIVAEWDRAFLRGDTFEMEMRLRRHDGAMRWFLSRGIPVRDESGRVTRWFGTSTDIDDQKRSAIEQTYLAELGHIVNESVRARELVQHVADASVPTLGAWCRIAIGEGDDEIIDVHAGATVHPSDRRAALSLGVRGSSIGTMTIGRPTDAGAFTERELGFLEEVARRTAIAVQNARLYEREHRVSEAMQAASLPKNLPDVPWLALDAIYAPGRSEAQIGGDWYDAFRLADGRIVVSIGDVAGSGLDAAVTMSNMRQIIRGTAQVHADPILMLNAADRALRVEDPERFVTAFVAVFDPIERAMTYASAGHTPPYVRRADGSVLELEFSDLPLGLRERQYLDAKTLELQRDDLVLLYTDGLTESERDLERGTQRLRDALASPEILRAPRPAEFVRSELLPAGARDDVAILALRVLDLDDHPGAIHRWRFESLDGSALYRMRAQFRDALALRTNDAERLEYGELVLGELAGNAVRHAPGPVEIVLDLSNDRAVLHVLDEGPGFARMPMLPLDVLSESGRGLYIVSQTTLEFSVVRRRPRGSHARAVLL